jgi:hypothetical protein
MRDFLTLRAPDGSLTTVYVGAFAELGNEQAAHRVQSRSCHRPGTAPPRTTFATRRDARACQLAAQNATASATSGTAGANVGA